MDAVFFPRNDYPNNVEICAHRFGKKMTYTDQTDGQHTELSYAPYMLLAKTRGIKVGCFLQLNNPIADSVGMKDDYDNGDIWFDVYSYTNELASKISGGQTITEEEWDNAYNSTLYPRYYNFIGKKPVALSYSYGNYTFSNYITQFLGGRNSGISSNTDYGVGYGSPSSIPYGFSTYKTKASTTRWYDQAKQNGNNFQSQLNTLGALIDATMLDGGWINNFTHWHNYYQDGNAQWAEAYLDLLESKNSNDEICFAGYGEALAYLVYRQMIKKVAMYSPIIHNSTQLIIQLETDNSELQVDADLLQVPISIRFSTVGTPLAGQSITSDCNLISLGGGEYIVEIPFSRFPKAIIKKQE